MKINFSQENRSIIFFSVLFIMIYIYEKIIDHNIYEEHKEEFVSDNIDYTIGVVYEAYSIKQTNYMSFTYRVDNQLYFDDISMIASRYKIFNKFKEEGVVKIPVVYLRENPRVNIIRSNYMLNSDYEIKNQVPDNVKFSSNEKLVDEFEDRANESYLKKKGDKLYVELVEVWSKIDGDTLNN